MFVCQACGKEVDIGEKIDRKDDCPFCMADLHSCIQCEFYDPGRHNDCRENQAEFVLEKEKSNFCGYFLPSGNKDVKKQSSSKDEAEKAWEAMFGKK